MRKNKYLVTFISVLFFTSITLGIIFKKFVLLFLHHTAYYCQGIFNTLPVRLPRNLQEAGVLAIISALLFLAIKLVATWKKTALIKSHLHPTLLYRYKVEKLSNNLGLQNRILVFKNIQPQAFCLGIHTSKIYLSTGLIKILSTAELEAVLRHEKYHLENKDILVRFVANLTHIMFPFFPILTDISKQYRIQNEIMADEAAVKGMRNSTYLISVLRKLVSFEPENIDVFAIPLAEWETLEFRIHKLINRQTKDIKMPMGNIVMSFLSFFVLGLLALTPIYAVEFHNKGEDTVILCTAGQSCNNICESRVTELFSHN